MFFLKLEFRGGFQSYNPKMEIDKAIKESDDRRLKMKYNSAIYVIQRALALYSYALRNSLYSIPSKMVISNATRALLCVFIIELFV